MSSSRRFATVRTSSIDADGFVDLEVWRFDRDPGEVITVSRWRDRECFRNDMRSEAHAVSHGPHPLRARGAIQFERLEHLHVRRRCNVT